MEVRKGVIKVKLKGLKSRIGLVTNLRCSQIFREQTEKRLIDYRMLRLFHGFRRSLLLVLISLAGVLLMPSMQAEKQYSAAGYVTSSEPGYLCA